jgi:hypothetical protein
MSTELVFELDFKDGKIKVQRRTIAGNQTVYVIAFSDRRQPLVLTRATGTNIGRHWTSIPEGRFKEAQEVGPLIEQYIKSL